MFVCACVFVQQCLSPSSHVYFLCCLLLDSPPPCFSSLNNTSVRCSLRTRAREEERETWGHHERVEERDRGKGEEETGGRKRQF